MRLPEVLIIEDDPTLLRQLMSAFTAAGYSVRGAADGSVGLSAFSAVAADLVVTDLIMPTREGIETMMTLKAQCPELKIIAISGGMKIGPGVLLELALKLGADGALAKPFRHSDLIALADRLLDRKAVIAA